MSPTTATISTAAIKSGTSAPATKSAASQRVIHTVNGPVSGVPCGNPAYTVFRGVPYAAPPIGENRWRPPQPLANWDDVRVCDTFPPMSAQPGHKLGEFYQREFFPIQYPHSEDCLYLNIWTPSAAAYAEGEAIVANIAADNDTSTVTDNNGSSAPNVNPDNTSATPQNAHPVMVWIHGGAYIHGYGHEMEFDGEAFCKRGVILVSINYRLGAMGYFAAPGGVTGNYGLMDQIQALRWVQDNIAAFGGNPDCVTVFGQSAGGGSVLSLIASPLTKGLIHRAIIQSAGGISSLGGAYTLAEAERFGAFVCEHHGVTLDELRALPADTVNQMVMAASGAYAKTFRLRMIPCVDGQVLPDDPGAVIARGEHLPIPYMTGYVTGDSRLFGNSDIPWHKLKNHEKLFVYHFSREMPGGDGAFHSSELWYIFGTISRCWRPMNGHDYDLSLRMTDYWTNFAKNGDPNSEANTCGTDTRETDTRETDTRETDPCETDPCEATPCKAPSWPAYTEAEPYIITLC